MEEAEPPLFSAKFSLALLAVFLLPLVIRSLTTLEPFPSIILPGNAARINVEDGVARFGDLGLYADDTAGKRRRLPPEVLLGPIPTSYLQFIAGHGFGSAHAAQLTISVRGFGSFRIPRHVASSRARNNLRRWLRQNLEDGGFSGDWVVVRHDHVAMDILSGRELGRDLGREKRVDLK